MTANLLRHETSPYLRQHADNPVHWRPWGKTALAEARRLNRPILLSVGYAACHWCHVMAHESFEDPETAAVMNRLFVNIKVDREERPDVDQIYMAALHALGEQGGWPLTMFLTPDGEPLWGGTYFPKNAAYGRPAFIEVLKSIAYTFANDPDRVENNRAALLDYLRALPRITGEIGPDRTTLDEATVQIADAIDPDRGGLRGAPKFPQPTLLELLHRGADRTGDPRYGADVEHSLGWMLQGGVYDHVGGGLHRYSVDDRWLVPHFEKMLYDNALLIERAAGAFHRSGNILFRLRIEETIAWLLRDMRVGDAFAASLDADTPEGEGFYYTWTPAEIAAVLGSAAASFSAAYDITAAGNFEGRSIPNRLRDPSLQSPTQEARLAEQRAQLLAARQQRRPPGRDDKILADWNGFAIAALANAGATLQCPDWLDSAVAAYRFISESMIVDGRLRHSAHGKTILPVGFASDYAAMMKAAIALHQATMDPVYLHDAAGFADSLDGHYWDDQANAYRLTADDADDLIVRPLPLLDESVPSANALIATARLRLAALTGESRFAERADRLIQRHIAASSNVFGKAGLFNALDQRLNGSEIVLVEPAGKTAPLWRSAIRDAIGEAATLLIVSDGSNLPTSHPAHGKTAIAASPTVYVCRNNACSAPITDIARINAALRPPPIG